MRIPGSVILIFLNRGKDRCSWDQSLSLWETLGSEEGTSASASARGRGGFPVPGLCRAIWSTDTAPWFPAPSQLRAPPSSAIWFLGFSGGPLRPLPDASPRASGTCVKLNSF